MKKMITIVVLILGFLTWRMGAMEAQAEAEAGDVMLQTNDGQLVSISRKDARCFPTIIDAVSILSTDEPIPVNVTQPVLQRLLQDLDWVRAVCNERRPDETEQQCAERAARALPPSAYVYSDNSMRRTFENLAAAHYLGSLELQERYARILAGMLVSDQSLALLYSNNPAHIAFIQKIEPLRGDGDQKVYAENRNAGAFHIFARLIYKYIPEIEVWAQSSMLPHKRVVLAASFSPDSAKVATAADDNSIRIWNADLATMLFVLRGHSAAIHSVSFSPAGDKVVSAASDNLAKIWDVNTGTLLRTLKGHAGVVASASFSPDGTQVVTASDDGTVRLWDANTGASLRTLQGHQGHSYGAYVIFSAQFSPDGSRVVTASSDREAKIWDANTGALLRTLQGHRDLVRSAQFSPNGMRVVTASGDREAKIWNANTGALLHTLRGHVAQVRSASFSPDGTEVVTASDDGTVRLWDANNGALLRTLEGHTDWVLSASFSPDGNKVVTASCDRTARIWRPIRADSFDQALFIHMLRWAQRNNKPVGWQTGWGRMVMDTYNPDVEAMIKEAFPKSLMEKMNEKVGRLFR